MVVKFKIYCVLSAFILFSFSISANNLSFDEQLLNLNEEYKNLVIKESERFKEEEESSELSKKKIESLYEIKEKIEEEISNKEQKRQEKFFKDDYDKLIKKYENYLKKIEKEIVTQEKIVSDFEIIKTLRGE